jgi:hypothetical protein
MAAEVEPARERKLPDRNHSSDLEEGMMTSPYLFSPARSRRRPTWRRWLLVLLGIAALFLAPALAHSDPSKSPDDQVTALPSGVSQLGYAVTASDQSHHESGRSDSMMVEIGDSGTPVNL